MTESLRKTLQEMNWIGKPEKAKYIPTENPIEEIWHRLSILKFDRFLLEHDPDLEKERINSITGCFMQALEYKKAAEISTDHTRPLLLYYCHMNLVKAVLTTISDKEISPFHGLKRPDINVQDLLDSTVITDNGVFMSLAEYANTRIPKDFVIKISNVLNRIIEMKETFERFYRSQSEAIYVKYKITFSGIYYLFLDRSQLPNISDFKENWVKYFPILKEKFDLVDSDDKEHAFAFKAEYFDKVKSSEVFQADERNLFDKLSTFIKDTGMEIFQRDKSTANFRPHILIYSKGYEWPQVLFYYVMVYFLGMLVRYEPDIWYEKVIDKEEGGIWVYSKFCNIAERVFPNLMLDMLHGENFVFTSTAGLF